MTLHELERLEGAIEYLDKHGFHEPAKNIRLLLNRRAPSPRVALSEEDAKALEVIEARHAETEAFLKDRGKEGPACHYDRAVLLSIVRRAALNAVPSEEKL